MKPINLFWCRGRGRSCDRSQNFGDFLSPLLVEAFSSRPVVHAPIRMADMIAVGSVLSREQKAKGLLGFPRRLHIWGTGSGSPSDVFSGRHYYHAVRGQLAKNQIQGLKSQPVLGDPGLLSPWLIKKPAKKHRIGVVLHFSHHLSDGLKAFIFATGAKFINVFDPVKQVLEDIASCDVVISSSLHGLIVADSFGVPNQWLAPDDTESWKYKFRDYYSSFGLMGMNPIIPQDLYEGRWSVEKTIEQYHRPGLEAMQHGLISAFPSF